MNPYIRPSVAAALACLILAAAAPVGAVEQESEQGWRLRVNGYWIDANEVRVDQSGSDWRSSTEHSAAAGAGVSGEYRFGPRLGLELGLLGGAETDFTVALEGGAYVASNVMAFDAACVGLNVHLTPGKKADVYAGPLVAYVSYSDMLAGVSSFTTAFTPRVPVTLASVAVRFDDELALGANLGVDVAISDSRWFFNADVRYLDANPDTTLQAIGIVREQSARFDPLMVGIGFGYRF